MLRFAAILNLCFLCSVSSAPPSYRFLRSENVKTAETAPFTYFTGGGGQHVGPAIRRSFSSGSSYTSGFSSGSAYTSGSGSTPSPTPDTYLLTVKLTLVGPSESNFTNPVRDVFSAAVAASPVTGTTLTSASVTISTPALRRDIAVQFFLDTETTYVSIANSVSSTTSTYLSNTGDGGFLTTLNTKLAAAGLSSSFTVTDVTGVSVSSYSQSDSSSGFSTSVIIGIVVGCVFGLLIICGVCYVLLVNGCPRSESKSNDFQGGQAEKGDGHPDNKCTDAEVAMSSDAHTVQI